MIVSLRSVPHLLSCKPSSFLYIPPNLQVHPLGPLTLNLESHYKYKKLNFKVKTTTNIYGHLLKTKNLMLGA